MPRSSASGRTTAISTAERAVTAGLFVVGYPVAIAVICRFVPVVRERRVRWFVAHQSAVGAIVVGQALARRPSGVVINAAWFVAAAIWYACGARGSDRS